MVPTRHKLKQGLSHTVYKGSFLLVQGWRPGGTCKGKYTVLYCATQWRRIEMVRFLHGLKCPAVPRGEGHRTPVHVAAEQGWADLLMILIEELEYQVRFPPASKVSLGGLAHQGEFQNGIPTPTSVACYMGSLDDVVHAIYLYFKLHSQTAPAEGYP
jgi:hypothetical protein